MKELTEDNEDFFELGELEGERKAQRRIKELEHLLQKSKKVNRHLLDIINEKDEKIPIIGVRLTHRMLNQVIKSLKVPGNHKRLADILKNHRDYVIDRDIENIKKFKQLVENKK